MKLCGNMLPAPSSHPRKINDSRQGEEEIQDGRKGWGFWRAGGGGDVCTDK